MTSNKKTIGSREKWSFFGVCHFWYYCWKFHNKTYWQNRTVSQEHDFLCIQYFWNSIFTSISSDVLKANMIFHLIFCTCNQSPGVKILGYTRVCWWNGNKSIYINSHYLKIEIEKLMRNWKSHDLVWELRWHFGCLQSIIEPAILFNDRFFYWAEEHLKNWCEFRYLN